MFKNTDLVTGYSIKGFLEEKYLSDSRLKDLCAGLAYTKSFELSDEIVEETLVSLKQLFSQYGYAEVLGELAKVWVQEKAVPFFLKAKIEVNNNGEIRTIATHYPRAYNGGVERVNAQLMTLWVQMGYKVVLLTEESENELDFPYPPEVKRFIIHGTSDLVGRLRTIQKYCMQEHVDVYVNHNWGTDTVLWECMMLKVIHVPFIQYMHAHFTWSIWHNKNTLCQPELFGLCDVILALSETNARFYQLCGCKSYLVQNPIPEDIIKNRTIAKLNSKHILMVGRLSAEKRPMDALRIFKLVNQEFPETVLDVVGGDDGNFVTQMEDYIREHGLNGKVIFHGKKNQNEVAEFYKNSMCVLLTSEMESYCMVILESKAYGLPVVMYNLPYLALVKDGKGILTATIGDIEGMAKHVIYLLKNSSFRIALGRSARESFDDFTRYDAEMAWKNISMLCSSNGKNVDDLNYFNPEKVQYGDKYILPMLLDSMKRGYDHVLYSSHEYQVGKRVLKYIDIVKSKGRGVKEILFHRKDKKE